MKPEKDSSVIDDILQLSETCETPLREKIEQLVRHCGEREKYFEKRIEEEIAKREERERILQSQAKMAAMGEMMDAVAHQWKQPLNALSMYSDLLRMDFEAGEVDAGYIDRFVEDLQEQINHMVSTLSEFRTFFRPDKEKEPFGLKRCTQSVLLLIHDEMLRNNITVDVESDREIIVHGIENEFKHLLLNLLSNAKDALVDNGASTRRITVRFYRTGERIIVEVEDTAGGIPEEILNDIFKPNFTTKEKGTGIGLYMSTQIAQKMQGTLSASNTSDGAKFTLTLPSAS